jgi:ABC-type spermidine/putrescine transport system permease subunit II
MPVSRYAGLIRWGLRSACSPPHLFLYLPIVFMVAFSFDDRHAEPADPGPTLHWYDVMINNRQLLTAVENTVSVSLIVAVLATIIGTMAAFVLVRGRLRYPNGIRIVFTLPIMVPGVLIGIALLVFFSRALHANLSLMTVIAGQLVVTVPFVVLIVASRPAELRPQARVGGRRSRRLPRAHAPPCRAAADRAGDPCRGADLHHAVHRRIRHHLVHGRNQPTCRPTSTPRSSSE